MQSGRSSRPRRDLSPRRASLERILQARAGNFQGPSSPALFGGGDPTARQQAELEEHKPVPYNDSPVELDSLVDTMEEFDSLCDELGSTLRRLEQKVNRPVGREVWSIGSSLAGSPRSHFLSDGGSETASSFSPGDSGDRYTDRDAGWDMGLTAIQTTTLRRRIANPRPRPTDNGERSEARDEISRQPHSPAEKLGPYFAQADDEASPARARAIFVEDVPADPTPRIRILDAEELEAQAKLWRHGRSCIQQGAKKFLARVEAHAKDAAMTVVDLYEGRLDNGLYTNSRKAPAFLKVFKLHTSSAWGTAFVTANIVHCALAFWSNEVNELPLQCFLSAVEFLCIAVYAADIYMKSFYQGFKTFASKKWQKRLLVVCGILFLDYLLPLWSWRVPTGLHTAPLRPGILVCRHRETRQFFDLVITLLPKTARLGVPIVFLIFMYSVVAFEFFGPGGEDFLDRHHLVEVPDITISGDIGDLGNIIEGGKSEEARRHLSAFYNNPLLAFYQLTVLMFTGDTFQNLAPPTNGTQLELGQDGKSVFDVRTTHGNVIYMYFFTSFVLVAGVLFVDLVLGSVYESFHEGAEDQTKGSVTKEVKGLIRAFQFLDITGFGTISEPMFIRFLVALSRFHSIGENGMIAADSVTQKSKSLAQVVAGLTNQKHKITPAQGKLERDAKLFFLLAADFSANSIDLISFLSLREVLSYQFVYEVSEDVKGESKAAATHWSTTLGQKTRKMLPFVLLADIFFHLLDWQEHTHALALGNRLPVSVAFDMMYIFDLATRKSGDSSDQPSGTYTWVADYCCGLHLSVLAAEAVCSRGAAWLDMPVTWATSGTMMPRVYYAVRESLELFRVLRLVDINATLHHYIDTLSDVMPVLYQCVLFVLLIAYTYATCGVLLLGAPCGITALDSPSKAMATILMLFFDVDFQETMETSVEETSPAWVRPIVCLYFFLFHILGVMVFLNVINAIIITFYSNGIAAREAAQQYKETLEAICQNLMTKLSDRKRLLQMKLRKRADDTDSSKASASLGAKASGPKSCVDVLKALETFQGFTTEQLEHAASRLIEERFEPGGVVVVQGDVGEKFYIIVEGHALVYFTPPGTAIDRKRLTTGATEVGRLDEMQWFGEVALLKDERRSASIVAGAGGLTVLQMSKADFGIMQETVSKQMTFLADRRTASMAKIMDIDDCLRGLSVLKGNSLDSVSLMRKLVVDPGSVDPVTGFFTSHKRVTLKELMTCQKHAKGINLEAAYWEKNHGSRAWREVEHRFRMNLLRLRKAAAEEKAEVKKDGKKDKHKAKDKAKKSKGEEKKKAEKASDATADKDQKLGREVVFRNAGDLVIPAGAPVEEVALVNRGGLVVKSSGRGDGATSPGSPFGAMKRRKTKWRTGEIAGELAFLTRSANTDGDIVAEVDDTEVTFVNLSDFLKMDRSVLGGFAEHVAQAHVET